MKKIAILIFFCITNILFSDVKDTSGDQSDLVLKLSLKDSIDLAIKNNLSLKKERFNFKDKEVDVWTLFNKFYPDLGASSSLNFKPDSAGINFSLSSGYTFNAKTIFEIAETNINYKLGKIGYEQAQKSIVKNIKKLYFRIVLQKKELFIKEKILENAKNRLNKAIIQFKDGEVSDLDKMNEELTYKTLQPEVAKLKNDIKNNLNQFCLLIGLEPNKEVILIDEIPKIEDTTLVNNKIDLDDNPDIKILKLKIEKEKNSRNITITSLTPTVKLNYSVSISTLKNLYSDSWSGEFNKEWSNSQNFSLSLSLPLNSLLPLSQTQVNLIKNDNSLNRAKIDLANEKLKKEVDLLTLVLNLNYIKSTFDTLNFNLNLSQKILTLTEKSYYEGDKNHLDVKDAEKNMLDANLKLDKAYYDYYDNYTELEYLLNQ